METTPQPPASPPSNADGSASPARRPDLRNALRAFLVLDLAVRLLVWCGALALSITAFNALDAWPRHSLTETDLRHAWYWAKRLGWFILLFNVIYVGELLVLRLLIPTTREGRYPMTGRWPGRQIIWSSLIAALVKARYLAPFPGFLVFHIANLPPMCWLMAPIFGPKSRSCYATEPGILDPHLVSIGRNVVIGFNVIIVSHYQDRDWAVVERTIIDDNVVLGGQATIMGGVHIREGAMIGSCSLVLPNTVVGPNEFWAGVPARKIRDLPPVQ
jgi:acetyltransferase-like isoleucine patch superfamily enzyme